MSLTTQDLQDIRGLMVDVVNDAYHQLFNPRFESIESRLDDHSQILDEHTRILNEHTGILTAHGRRLSTIETKLVDIDGRIKALEADIKELYMITTKLDKQQSSTVSKLPKKLSKLTTEQKVLVMYNDFLALAKQLDITLPSA